MGATLIIGERFFPNFTIMWFASPDMFMALWREALILVLGFHMFIRQHFDSVYLRLAWGILAMGLVWAGVNYFIDNPSFLFDAMLMIGVGACFGIDALQPRIFELESDAQNAISAQTIRDRLQAYAQMYQQRFRLWLTSPSFIPDLQSAARNAIRDDSHILIIK